MICLKIRSFVVATTPWLSRALVGFSCDLLENTYLCGSNNNERPHSSSISRVVICLKIRTFVVATTTSPLRGERRTGCDLLENTYLCGSNNNSFRSSRVKCVVVICLKIRTFVVATTTWLAPRNEASSCDLLENTYLCGSNNNSIFLLLHPSWCCDLLENTYLCGSNNNQALTSPSENLLWFAWKYVPLW